MRDQPDRRGILNILQKSAGEQRFSEKSLNNSPQRRNPRFLQTFQRVRLTPLAQESLIFRAFPDSVMSTTTRDNLNISLNHASDTRFSDLVLNISRNQDGVERFSDFKTQRFLWHSVGGYRESSFESIRDLEHRGVERVTRNRRYRADNLRPRAKPEPEKRK